MDWSEIKHIHRKILKSKTYSLINVISLSIGLICSVFAFLYIQYEYKVDTCYSNTKDVYRLTINNVPPEVFHIGQPPVFFEEIVKEIPEIESGSRIFYDPVNMKIENKHLNSYFLGVDSSFFNFIGWDLIVGNPDMVLATPFSVVISESKAKQFFRDKNPVGQVIQINNQFDYIITGIFKDLPEQSHLKADFFASISSMQSRNDRFFTSWGTHSTAFYLKVNAGSDLELTNKKIAELWNRKTTDTNCAGDFVCSKLQKFSDIHLRSGYLSNNPGNIIYVIGVSIIALLILFISCFNFINLSIAVSGKRNTETGIKKVLGANLKKFIQQILLEITIYLSIALFVCFATVKILLPGFSSFLGKNLEYSLQNYYPLIFFVLLVCLTITLLVCISPIIQTFRVNAVNVLKGASMFPSARSTKINSRFGVKNSLVIIQFAVGIALILSSLVINEQLRLIRQHDLGFNKEQVLVIRNNIGNRDQRFKVLKNNLLSNPDIKLISSASHVPAAGLNNWGGPLVAGDESRSSKQCGLISINHEYFQTIGSEFISGRNFNNTNTSDRQSIIINEALQKELELEDPVGKKLITLRDKKEKEIIGVVKDIEFLTIHNENVPTMFFLRDNGFDTFSRYIVIKLQSADLTKTISGIKETWSEVSPEYPIDYFFLDDMVDQNYKTELQTATIMNVMTIIAIMLCCLGLFGLAVFNINGRIKEIGIRKVNGAKISEILTMLNRDFIKWVGIAFIIACPIAYYAMNKWLENFAHKTTLSWWIFALAGVLALAIALLTVSFQSYKAATRNPIESLRYE